MFIAPHVICPACGAALAPQDRYCEACGHPCRQDTDRQIDGVGATSSLDNSPKPRRALRILYDVVMVLTAFLIIAGVVWLLALSGHL